jgi:hypothetical protein
VLAIWAWYAERRALRGAAEQLRWEARHIPLDADDQRDVLLASAHAVERYAATGPVMTICGTKDMDPATLAALGRVAEALISTGERAELGEE